VLEFLDLQGFPRTNPLHIAGFSSFGKQFVDGANIAEVKVSQLVSHSVLSWHSDIL
jgi:hypothetical protein